MYALHLLQPGAVVVDCHSMLEIREILLIDEPCRTEPEKCQHEGLQE